MFMQVVITISLALLMLVAVDDFSTARTRKQHKIEQPEAAQESSPRNHDA